MCIMHTIERRLFFFSGLLAVVQLGNTGPVPELSVTSSVSKLIESSASDKFVNYFKELRLDEYCDSPLLNEERFKAYEINNPIPCLCTVIYHMTKELDLRNVSLFSVEAAKNKTDIGTFNDPSVYKIWKNVSKMSPFLKLLMEPLKNIAQLNKMCYYGFSNAINSYCKFLYVEVLLLHSFLPKPEESMKEVSVSLPENIKRQIPNVLTKESKKSSKKSKTQLETDDEFNTEDAQKPNYENNNFTTEDEMDQQTNLKNADAPAKTKINSQPVENELVPSTSTKKRDWTHYTPDHLKFWSTLITNNLTSTDKTKKQKTYQDKITSWASTQTSPSDQQESWYIIRLYYKNKKSCTYDVCP